MAGRAAVTGGLVADGAGSEEVVGITTWCLFSPNYCIFPFCGKAVGLVRGKKASVGLVRAWTVSFAGLHLICTFCFHNLGRFWLGFHEFFFIFDH